MKVISWLLIMLLSMSSYTSPPTPMSEPSITKPNPEAPLVLEIADEDKPAVTEVSFKMKNTEGLENVAYLENIYGIYIIPSEVVGLVGGVVKLETNTPIENGKLTFKYDVTKLGDTKEEDLVVMWLDEDEQWFEVITDKSDVNTKDHTVTCDVKEGGIYLLEDHRIWIAVWSGTYDYPEEEIIEADPSLYDWRNYFNSKDIEKLADTSWYKPEQDTYHIGTAEQLAGIAQLTNTGESFYGKTFILDKDIDLKGYNWAPIGWYRPSDTGIVGRDYPFDATFDGNYHTIKNLSIKADYPDIGLFGRTTMGFTVKNLGIKNCNMQGRFGVGGLVGDNIAYKKSDSPQMVNCYVTGKISGGSEVGALVGSTASMKIKDCYALAEVIAEEDAAGGLVGNLRGGKIADSYFSGKVSGKDLIGCIVGEGGIDNGDPQYETEITSCYYNSILMPQGKLYGGGAFTKETKTKNNQSGKKEDLKLKGFFKSPKR